MKSYPLIIILLLILTPHSLRGIEESPTSLKNGKGGIFSGFPEVYLRENSFPLKEQKPEMKFDQRERTEISNSDYRSDLLDLEREKRRTEVKASFYTLRNDTRPLIETKIKEEKLAFSLPKALEFSGEVSPFLKEVVEPLVVVKEKYQRLLDNFIEKVNLEINKIEDKTKKLKNTLTEIDLRVSQLAKRSLGVSEEKKAKKEASKKKGIKKDIEEDIEEDIKEVSIKEPSIKELSIKDIKDIKELELSLKEEDILKETKEEEVPVEELSSGIKEEIPITLKTEIEKEREKKESLKEWRNKVEIANTKKILIYSISFILVGLFSYWWIKKRKAKVAKKFYNKTTADTNEIKSKVDNLERSYRTLTGINEKLNQELQTVEERERKIESMLGKIDEKLSKVDTDLLTVKKTEDKRVIKREPLPTKEKKSLLPAKQRETDQERDLFYAQIYKYHHEGLDVEEIAKLTNLSGSEIELILELKESE
ncbi:DUF2802 domain-containing protein [bacterium]|nr:DUF2802 domain-containing protein [bacterium]